MDTRAKATFVIPAYNAEKYLSTAVNSVIAQTIDDWEMIIVDDCSADRTLAIAEDFASRDTRITVIRMSQQSGGGYLPRREGILKATTDYIAPLDADDYIEPDYLSTLLKAAEENNADVVYPVMFIWDGKHIDLMQPLAAELVGKTLKGKDAVKYTLDGWRIHCNGGLIKRSVYLRSMDMVDYKQARYTAYIDEYLTRLILFNSGNVQISPTKYYYRTNPDSVSHIMDSRALGHLENNMRLLTMMKAFYPVDSEEWYMMQRHNFHTIFDTWRLLRQVELTEDEEGEVEKALVVCRNEVDFRLLKGKVSGRYAWLLRLPSDMGKTILKIFDYFHSED